jgi:hypothetical protein
MKEEPSMSQTNVGLVVEKAVHKPYSAAAKDVERNLCCPTVYDPQLLAAIPEEVLSVDTRCARHWRPFCFALLFLCVLRKRYSDLRAIVGSTLVARRAGK